MAFIAANETKWQHYNVNCMNIECDSDAIMTQLIIEPSKHWACLEASRVDWLLGSDIFSDSTAFSMSNKNLLLCDSEPRNIFTVCHILSGF